MSEQELYERVVELAADVLDASRDITVALSPYPLIAIVSVTAPSSARPGTTINISGTFKNNGGWGVFWFRMYDIDTQTDYIPRITQTIAAGETGSFTKDILMPTNRDLHVRIEIGHVE